VNTTRVDGAPVRIVPTHRVVNGRGAQMSAHDSLRDARGMREILVTRCKRIPTPVTIEEWRDDGWRQVFGLESQS
jgi:hypothetical protein